MHMTTISSTDNETPNHYSFWSYCLALASAFVIADVLTGGTIRESLYKQQVEYGLFALLMIVTVGVYASDGSPGLKFVRACSFHKL